MKVKSLSRVQLLATPWTAAYQAPPSMGFSRQEYWSGCHCLLQGQLEQGLMNMVGCIMAFKDIRSSWGCKCYLQSVTSLKSLSRVRLLATPWTAAYQAPPSMGFARQEYWNGLPLPSPYMPLKEFPNNLNTEK